MIIDKTYIFQNGKRVGYILLRAKLCHYSIELYMIGVGNPAYIVTTDDYFLALHKVVIMRNKYSY